MEGVVSQALELQGACSYGVQIPNSDGRAGMVTIPTDEKEDVNLEQLYKGTELNLPAYARPLFVRLAPELPLTGKSGLSSHDYLSSFGAKLDLQGRTR